MPDDFRDLLADSGDMPPGTETKIFDPRDAATGSGGAEVTDACVVKRGNQWWMYLAGQPKGYGATDLYSACLAPDAPLSVRGWTLVREADGSLRPLAGRSRSGNWDGKGGRHCPSYVRGWDPGEERWVERIYYAGAAENVWGPYTIGFLEWDGEEWVDQAEPAFAAEEDWEHGSVYEPNLIYHEDRWKMWFVAGSNHEDYLVHGYAESRDGRTGWSQHEMFAPAEMKMFDFCVRQGEVGFEAVYSRVWMGTGAPPPETGLWWCRAEAPSKKLCAWGTPRQIQTAADRGWHSGGWKPSFQLDGPAGRRAFVFFDGLYRTEDPGPFPFAFTVGCLEVDLPESQGRVERSD
ncbi:hypothetical protein DYQ86_26430 [Acidobacteria bacterium AB60]|nr:hypothetical protein DYQ86_26430 [Acidobacteria bacterium AB60]